MDVEERKMGKERKRRKKEESEMEERAKKRKRESGPLSRRLLSVWPALPALRAPDGTLLKFIDNHKFRK